MLAASEDCTTDLTLLQEKYVQAHSALLTLILEVTTESEDTTCTETATATYNTEISNMEAGRESATEKIEESETAMAALQPMLEEMRVEVSQVESLVSQITQECQASSEVFMYITTVYELIQTTLSCPGVDTLTLGVPVGTYKELRFTVTKIRDPNNEFLCENGCTQLAELELEDSNGLRVDTALAELKGGPLADHPHQEGPEMLTDQDLGTKWVDNSASNHAAYVTIVLEKPTRFERFRIGTANDMENRDPIRWKLEGKEEGQYAEWETIYCQQTDLLPPETRNTWMDWITVERDTDTGKPEAALKVCAA